MALTIIKGEDRTLNFRIRDSSDAPIDLTSATNFEGRILKQDDSVLDIPNGSFTVVGDPKLGRISFIISAANTALLKADTSAQDFTLVITFGAVKRVYNVLQSLIINDPSVSLT